MAGRDIVIDQDALEYTPRDGLRTREPLQVEVGAHTRVVIRRPARLEAASAYGAFRHDSAFPHGSVLALLLGRTVVRLLERFTAEEEQHVIQIYGHTSPSGDESHNKDLSERRARAFAALLTASPDDFKAIAEQESWGLEHHQLLLRVLRCDPGPIDGQPGSLTAQGVEWFQQEYRDGLFHREGHSPSRPDLEPTGELDASTVDALYEAFCESVSPGATEAELHPVNPVVGCSEYNLANTDAPEFHRRVTLVVHDKVLPFASNAPCTDGEHTKCSLDQQERQQRCLWYRDHVLEPDLASVEHLHFDLRWLPLPNGRILLTALTTLPEGRPVTFQVFKTTPILDRAEIRDEVLDTELSSPLVGEVVLGVAQVVWSPPEAFDIHDFVSWKAKNRASTPLEAWNAPAGSTIPVFRVSGGGATALSPPPGTDLDRILCDREPNQHGQQPHGIVAWDAFGNQYNIPLEDGRVPTNIHTLSDEIPRIVTFGYSNLGIDDEQDTRGLQ